MDAILRGPPPAWLAGSGHANRRRSRRTIQAFPRRRLILLARPSPWPDKVIALLRAGNPPAAIAQIKVAPSARELRALERMMATAQLAGRWSDVDLAIRDSIQALSAPRLHRSP